MKNSIKLLIFCLAIVTGLFIASNSADAYMYGWGMMPAMWGSSYGYSPYNSYYGYAGPYSYQYVPGSFWGGHYYNPGLYYSALDYSLQNNLLAYSQQNTGMMYGFISQNTR